MTLSHGSSIVRDGLVLHLDAANVKSYPGSGTAWKDLSGKGHDGTLVNGPVYNSNGYIDYDGVNDYAEIPNHSDFQFTTAFTQLIWFRLNSPFGTAYKTLFGKYNYRDWGIIVEWYTNNPVIFDFTTSGTTNRNILGAVTPNYNGWVMLARTYDKSLPSNNHNAWVFDVDGVQKRTSSPQVDINVSSNVVRIGDTGGGDFDIGTALLYNRGLTEEEIYRNFEALRGRYGI